MLKELEVKDIPINKTMLHRELGECWEFVGRVTSKHWKRPWSKEVGYLHRYFYGKARGRPLEQEENLLALCLNPMCIRVDHHVSHKKNETMWFHRDWETYQIRKARMEARKEARRKENLFPEQPKKKTLLRKKPAEFYEQERHVREIMAENK